VLLLAGCGSKTNTLAPQGPQAKQIASFWWWLLGGCSFGLLFVTALLLLAWARRGSKGPGREPGERAGWIVILTLGVGVMVTGMVVLFVGGDIFLSRHTEAPAAAATSLTVRAVGHQWWWEFDYPAQKIHTANVMHIPVGENVYVSLCGVGASESGSPYGGSCGDEPPPGVGDAVIHSFWVPALNGKQDVVPGRTNHLTLYADHPGVYPGQCYEYCGFSHANMKFKVVAQTPSDFQAWVAAQQAPPVAPSEGSLAAKGMDLFTGAGGEGGQCIACHTINGLQNPQTHQPLDATGGPNLTHFKSRDCFAGCMMANTPANVERWLADPRAIKPGSWMPNYHLTPDEIKALTAYLETLT